MQDVGVKTYRFSVAWPRIFPNGIGQPNAKGPRLLPPPRLQRATAEGVPVKGYFHWSLTDNFEWSDGFANRFGLVYVDFKTQKRTPKLSAAYFRETVARNAVV